MAFTDCEFSIQGNFQSLVDDVCKLNSLPVIRTQSLPQKTIYNLYFFLYFSPSHPFANIFFGVQKKIPGTTTRSKKKFLQKKYYPEKKIYYDMEYLSRKATKTIGFGYTITLFTLLSPFYLRTYLICTIYFFST